MAAPKKSPIVAKPPRPKIPEFRAAIAQAVADGIDRDTLVLRLTLRDESDLRRNPSVAVEEISYADGAMRFLGVRVVGGGTESVLDTSGVEPEPVEPKPAKAKKVAAPRKKAEAAVASS
jgi:hypothetical protein